jgi:hypothetical protein
MTNKGQAFHRLIAAFFLALFVGVVAVAVFNYAVDSVGLFHPKRGLMEVAKSLFAGKMVAGAMDYDEREFQRFIIENNPARIDAIAIGSSRTMGLRGVHLGGSETFFNHSMAAASLEDYIGLIGIYRGKKELPKVVILGIDPWVFNKNNGLTRWRVFGQDYEAMVREIAGQGGKGYGYLDKTHRYGQLVSFDYTVANVNSLKKGRTKEPYVTTTVDVDDFVRKPDGSLSFPFSQRFRKDEETRRLAAAYPSKRERYLTGYEGLSNVKLFEDFVNYLQKKGVKVIFLLPPFHPITYERMIRYYPMVPEVERYLRNFAASRTIPVVGSFDPEANGFTSLDFFDGSHGHETVLKSLFQGLQEGPFR